MGFCRVTPLKISKIRFWKKLWSPTPFPLNEKGQHLQAEGRIVVLSVAKMLARAIKSIHDETSVSSLFI